MLDDDHVARFNDHRQCCFFPSERICLDESIARWYGQGGHWINMGLPMYIAIDWKLENGCEIQNAACGVSGVMIWLRLVKTAEEEASNHGEDHQDHLPHGAQVLRWLVSPWANSDWIVCADSYFASVTAALELKKIGLRFIGVVKTATRRFPMAYLQGLELQKQGDRKGLIMKEGGRYISPLICVDGSRTPVLYCKWIKFDGGEVLQSNKMEANRRRGVAREGRTGSATASSSRDLL
jgi:Transposase IS4